MTVPRENYLAASPEAVTVGNITLRPLTLRGVIDLAHIGVDDLKQRVPREHLFSAAFILSQANSYKRFLRHARCGLMELSNAVEKVLNDAFETWIRPKTNKPQTVFDATPNGLGWPLEYAEWLCAEYGWSLEYALTMPVATVFALAAACHQRHGGKHAGLDYIERKYRADVKAGEVKPFKIG